MNLAWGRRCLRFVQLLNFRFQPVNTHCTNWIYLKVKYRDSFTLNILTQMVPLETRLIRNNFNRSSVFKMQEWSKDCEAIEWARYITGRSAYGREEEEHWKWTTHWPRKRAPTPHSLWRTNTPLFLLPLLSDFSCFLLFFLVSLRVKAEGALSATKHSRNFKSCHKASNTAFLLH